MATVIGGVAITINAVSKGFSKGIDKARGMLRGFTSGIGKVMKVLTSFRTLLLGVAAGAVAAFVKRTLDSIDALVKTADKLGIAIDELQALRLAAELSGLKVTTLDMALQRFTRRVSEAAIGTGEAQAAIKELGLDAGRLARMAPDEAIREVADAFAQVGSQSDKVRLAFKLFDSEGVALVNVLAKGRKGLDDVEERMRSLNIAISRVDAAQIEAAKDALLVMKHAIQGTVNTLVIELAPAIKVIADEFSKLAASGNSAMSTLLDSTEALAQGLNIVLKALIVVQRESAKEVAALADLELAIGRSNKNLGDTKSAKGRAIMLGVLERAAEDAGKQLDFYNEIWERTAEDIGKSFDEMRKKIAEGIQTPQIAGPAIDFDRLKREVAEFKKLQSIAARVIESIKTPQEKMIEETVKLFELWHNGLITMKQWSKALDLVQKKYQAIADAAKTTAEATKITPPGLAGAEVAGSAAAVRGTLDRGNRGLNDLVTQGRLQFMTLKEIEQEQRRQSRYLQRLADGTVVANLN